MLTVEALQMIYAHSIYKVTTDVSAVVTYNVTYMNVLKTYMHLFLPPFQTHQFQINQPMNVLSMQDMWTPKIAGNYNILLSLNNPLDVHIHASVVSCIKQESKHTQTLLKFIEVSSSLNMRLYKAYSLVYIFSELNLYICFKWMSMFSKMNL